MKKSNKDHILGRSLWLILCILMFASWIGYTLFKTTIVHAPAWNAKADSVLTRESEKMPERGMLLADDGSVLAANLLFYTARIDWKTAGINDSVFYACLPALCDSLHAFDPSMTAEQWQEKLEDGKAKKKRSFRLVGRLLTHSEYKRLRTFPFLNQKKNKSGFYYEKEPKRSKPYGSMASRSIGSVSENETSRTKHGRSGLEMALDSLLYGTPGVEKWIQLTSNIKKWEVKPAKKGYDITTTINVGLQDIVETELYDMCKETDAKWGTAILMEVKTGEIKAISNLEWDDTFGDYIEGKNNAVLGYEPGSVMKPISMMVALEDGIVSDIDEKIQTGSVWNYEGRPIKDPHGGAALSPREIIETSSNIGMSKIITRKYATDPGKFHDRLEEMGFFDPINSGIGGEKTPVLQRLGRKKADRVALTRMCFGYSSLIPPLSTLAIYNAIANDGKYVRPHLVKKLSREGEPDSIVPVSYIRQQVCSPENAKKLRIMLHDVVWGDRGTARKWVRSDKVEIAGKTGTAYTIQNGQYTTQKRLAFCGFFPYENPKYSCIVLMLGANRGAGASSGVVLKNVALKMYARGLLDNESDYEADSKGKEKSLSPTLYACNDVQRDKIKKILGVGSVKSYNLPAKGKPKTVPDVKGLGLRAAVKLLEDVGIAVRFHGSGYVLSQSIAPGTEAKRGEIIELKLRN